MTTAPPSPTAQTSRGLPTVVLGLSLMVVAANLRPTLTALGPVLGLIREDTGLSPAALGLLGAVPLLAFAGVSPLVQLISRRWGPDHTVFAATLVMVVATIVRSLPGAPDTPAVSLWLGTVVLGSGIAVCNVLVPALVKRDFPTEVPLMTGAYTAVLSGSAALASGLSLPIAHAGGWRLGLGVWGVVGVLALVAWWPRLRHHRRDVALPDPPASSAPTGRSVWTSALAWQVTAYMGTQAIYFYLFATWLPSIRIARGVGAVAAGWELSAFQAAGIAGGLLVGLAMRGRRDHRTVAVGVTTGMLVGVLGLLLLPGAGLLWILVGGLCSGASLVVALSFVAERSRTTADAGRLSGMAQSIGYLLAVLGPIGAGALFQATGGWTSTLVALAVVMGVQLVVSVLAGRDAYVRG